MGSLQEVTCSICKCILSSKSECTLGTCFDCIRLLVKDRDKKIENEQADEIEFLRKKNDDLSRKLAVINDIAKKKDLGRLARSKMVDITDNPYDSNDNRAKIWEEGWSEIDSEIRLRELESFVFNVSTMLSSLYELRINNVDCNEIIDKLLSMKDMITFLRKNT